MPVITLLTIKLNETYDNETATLKTYYDTVDDYHRDLIYREYIMLLGREQMLKELLAAINKETD